MHREGGKESKVPQCNRSSVGTPAEGCPRRDLGARGSCFSRPQEPGFTSSLNLSLPIKINPNLQNCLKERRDKVAPVQAPCETDRTAPTMLSCVATELRQASTGGMEVVEEVTYVQQCCLGVLMRWLCAALHCVDTPLAFLC